MNLEFQQPNPLQQPVGSPPAIPSAEPLQLSPLAKLLKGKFNGLSDSLSSEIAENLSNLENLKIEFEATQDLACYQKIESCILKISSMEEIKEIFSPLEQIVHFSETNLIQELFHMNHEMEELMKKTESTPVQESCRGIYDKMQEILIAAKTSIKQNPRHRVSLEASDKGKASNLGAKATVALTSSSGSVSQNTQSAQKVMLLKDQGAVFKQASKGATREQLLADMLLNIKSLSGSATVGTSQINPKIGSKFTKLDFPKSQDIGLSAEKLSNQALERIELNITKEEKVLLDRYKKRALKDSQSPEAILYHQALNNEWYVKMPDQEGKMISFYELEKLERTNQLSENTLVGSSAETTSTMSVHLEAPSMPNFLTAITYLRKKQTADPDLLIIPYMSQYSPHKKLYEKCRLYQWSYTNELGKLVTVDFKTLCFQFLENKTMNDLKSVHLKLPPIIESDVKVVLDELSWKIVGQELLEIVKVGDYRSKVVPLKKIDVKPLVNMIEICKLKSEEKAFILKKITDNSMFDALSTGEVQLLDLHAGNVGVKMASTPLADKYKDTIFTISGRIGNYTLQQLTRLYGNKEISLDANIQYTDDKGIVINQPIIDCIEVKEVLNGPWEFVFFDTDMSIGESNTLQTMKFPGRDVYLIPIRSVFLQTSFKDISLSDTVIANLMDSESRDLAVESYAKRWDAPIYQRLTPANKRILSDALNKCLTKFSMSRMRRESLGLVFDDLRGPFTTFMLEDKVTDTAIEKQNKLDFWTTFEIILPESLKITFKTPFSIKDKKKILALVFPRLSVLQQQALLERQASRKAYLSGYLALSTSKLEGEALSTKIQEFLNNPSTPLTLLEKQDFKKELITNPELVSDIHLRLCTKCKPTYFNLMKAMYPLLADAYDLLRILGESETVAGERIGHYCFNLDSLIKTANQGLSEEDPAYPLLVHLKKAISDAKMNNDVSLTGVFD